MGVVVIGIVLILFFILIPLAFFMFGVCREKKKRLIRLRKELRTMGELTKEREKELDGLINSCPYPF